MTTLYRHDAGRFTPTDLVTGPWDADHCHGGPPCALLTHGIHTVCPDMAMSRITFEIMHQIPKRPVTIRTEVIRGGKRVQLVRGDLIGDEGRPYLTAHAWLMRIDDEGVPLMPHQGPLPPPPESCPPFAFQVRDTPDIFDAMEGRSAMGVPFASSPATAWIRQTVPLVEGLDTSVYAKVAFAADSANGIARLAPFEDLLAINTDLTIYFARPPVGEWVAIEASTISLGLGLGMTDSLVYDASGFVGRSNQSIYLDAS
ncbi:MAG: thioesterase family protein [Actinomycetia bacterium]|nr:thioesterase family protein [Actinomycetes bacterium]